MKNKYIIYALSIMFVCCSVKNIQAQVTIGGGDSPAKGMLLQLKDQAPDNDNVTATKGGLILPRISLIESNSLEPFIDATPDEQKEHVALMVYNTNRCLNQNGDDHGLHIWYGDSWRKMGGQNAVSSEVLIYYDQEDKPFFAREFGSAGVWMIENLKVKSFDPVRDAGSNDPITIVLPTTPEFASTNNPRWAYPNATDGSSVATDETLFKEYNGLGLLYNWAAATNRSPSSLEEGGVDPAGTHIQGVCPSGWHLPTDYEWTRLENVMKSETSLYSNTQNIGGAATIPGNASMNVGLGLAFKSSCEPYASPTMQGTSNIVREAGFWGNSGKMQQYGSTGSYWSVSSSTSANAWSRSLSKDSNLIIRAAVAKQNYASVRCVQNR